jgi:hypothetical protein
MYVPPRSQAGASEPAQTWRRSASRSSAVMLFAQPAAGGERRGGGGPVAQQLAQGRTRRAVDDVERRDVQARLRRRHDPRLVLAVEVDGALYAGVLGAAGLQRPGGCGADGEPADARADRAQERAAIDAHHQPWSFAATRDSGSASASTSWLNRRRCCVEMVS